MRFAYEWAKICWADDAASERARHFCCRDLKGAASGAAGRAAPNSPRGREERREGEEQAVLSVCCLHITATDSSAVGRERERGGERERGWDEAAGTEGDKWPERKEGGGGGGSGAHCTRTGHGFYFGSQSKFQQNMLV